MSSVRTAVILAGGQNTRYPSLKSFIELGGVCIIERTVGLLRKRFPTVLLSTNQPERYFHLGIPMIGDVLPSRGPMSGMHAALLHADGDASFFLACDMPFAADDVVACICEHYGRAAAEGPVDAVVPVFHGRPQPLIAVYAKSVLPALGVAVCADKVALLRFFEEVRTAFVAEAVLKKIDSGGRSFVNINTVDDYAAAVASLEQSRVSA
ncbi:MAG TPA: molybdenum cofactor guanylyltransferase [Dissulfurispiraceae bacterium]|nr:molybdenum cofactor guanylyltransferase [Dissulfurispiraceae bacterium]